MIFLTRREGVSREAFADWWLTQHRPLAERLPGLRSHAFNLLPGDGPVDAIVEQWFESPEALMACYDTDAGRAVVADSARFVGERRRVMVDDHNFQIGQDGNVG